MVEWAIMHLEIIKGLNLKDATLYDQYDNDFYWGIDLKL